MSDRKEIGAGLWVEKIAGAFYYKIFRGERCIERVRSGEYEAHPHDFMTLCDAKSSAEFRAIADFMDSLKEEKE